MADKQSTQTTEKVSRTVDPAGPSVTTERSAEQSTTQTTEKGSSQGSQGTGSQK